MSDSPDSVVDEVWGDVLGVSDLRMGYEMLGKGCVPSDGFVSALKRTMEALDRKEWWRFRDGDGEPADFNRIGIWSVRMQRALYDYERGGIVPGRGLGNPRRVRSRKFKGG